MVDIGIITLCLKLFESALQTQLGFKLIMKVSEAGDLDLFQLKVVNESFQQI
jgi:hypothetical protein